MVARGTPCIPHTDQATTARRARPRRGHLDPASTRYETAHPTRRPSPTGQIIISNFKYIIPFCVGGRRRQGPWTRAGRIRGGRARENSPDRCDPGGARNLRQWVPSDAIRDRCRPLRSFSENRRRPIAEGGPMAYKIYTIVTDPLQQDITLRLISPIFLSDGSSLHREALDGRHRQEYLQGPHLLVNQVTSLRESRPVPPGPSFTP
jgi:hypothetical protein